MVVIASNPSRESLLPRSRQLTTDRPRSCIEPDLQVLVYAPLIVACKLADVSLRSLVLYVDCDAATVAQGVLLIRKLGHATIASVDADAALEIFAREPIAAVVLCESIAQEKLSIVADEMRFLKPHIPIVLSRKDRCVEYRRPTRKKAESLERILKRILGRTVAIRAAAD